MILHVKNTARLTVRTMADIKKSLRIFSVSKFEVGPQNLFLDENVLVDFGCFLCYLEVL